MAPISAPLEEQIQELEELDAIREQFSGWLEQGLVAIKHYVDCRKNRATPNADSWRLDAPPDVGDDALVVKSLCRPGIDNDAFELLLASLRKKSLNAILGRPGQILFKNDSSQTVFLDAAQALSALAGAPNAAFAPATMLYYYVTIRELYYPTPPLWVVGGARAGVGGRPSAYTTSQFVRGILSFARMLQRTSQYLGALAEMQHRATTGFREWDEQDAKRRSLSLKTTLAQRTWNLAFELRTPAEKMFEGNGLRKVRRELIAAISKSIKFFEKSVNAVKTYRKLEHKAVNAKRGDKRIRQQLMERSEGAHSVAIGALEDALERAEKAKRIFRDDGSRTPKGKVSDEERRNFADELRQLQQQFAETAAAVRKLVGPANDYLSTVLDTQLARAAATSDTIGFEAVEMASAAATLGAMAAAAGEVSRKTWDDERLARAATLLGAAMTPDGFAIGKPYHTGEGSYYQPTQPHIFGAYAQILEHVKTDLSLTILKRIARYFAINRRTIGEKASAWRWAHALPSSQIAGFHTAIAIWALDRLTRMLDRHINDRVLLQFGKKEPKKLRLQDLFYPDYGLASLSASSLERAPRIPIAVALERMRAHIAGIPLEAGASPLYSVIFHGPPGTGKTTLLEALAASAEVPLVEVTPSDIVVRGTEGVEARARAVLRALSLLTRVVVLFDEFDPVLKTRKNQQGATSIFTFLTPSMLPKLKTLYETAKSRHVAFALVTNVVRELDPAATRGGRFDERIGVYPPDAISRYGRLLSEVKVHIEKNKMRRPKLGKRFAEAIEGSECAAMQTVGQPGWFSRPRDKKDVRPDTLFGYLFAPKRASMPAIPPVDEATNQTIRLQTAGEKAEKSGDERQADEDLWSPEEKEEWRLILTLEKKADNDLSRRLWAAVENAFAA